MRNMSFSMTTQQVIDGTKTVTRRTGWRFLKPGNMVRPVLKGMGLKKGEKVKPLRGPLRIISVRREPLSAMTQAECIKEGFPQMGWREFIAMLCDKYDCDYATEFTRIEFEYTD